MKRIISLALVLTLFFAISAPVFAEGAISSKGAGANSLQLGISGRVVEISSANEGGSIDLSPYTKDGVTIHAIDYVKDVDLIVQKDTYRDMTYFTTLHARLFNDKEYTITLDMNPTNSDDVLFEKYVAIDNVVRLTITDSDNSTVKLAQSMTFTVDSTTASTRYIYNGSLNYLGMDGETIPFSDVYYISREKLNTSTPPGGNTSTSSGGGSGSSGGSNRADTFVSMASIYQPLDRSEAVNLAQNATGSTVTVRNRTTASVGTLNAMAATIDTSLTLHADTMTVNSTTVDVRLSFSPSQATKDMNLHATTGSTNIANAERIKSLFNSHFSNKITVVKFAQVDDFGINVKVALKVDNALDKDNLIFYHYDSKANSYQLLKNITYQIDQNGYVHFSVSCADCIIITDTAFQA